MNSKITSVIAVSLALVSGCSVISRGVATPAFSTPPTEAISPVPTTVSSETPSASEVFELTVAARDENFHSHVYAINVGCLNSTPCVVGLRLMFDVTYPVTGMSWSPNGQSLAFEGIGDGSSDSDIFVTLDEGKTIENITKTQVPHEGSPNWSPDGTRIAYAVSSSMEGSRIMVSSPDGTETEQILQDIFEPIEFAWSNHEWQAYSAFVSTNDSRFQIRVLDKDDSLYWLTPVDESKMLFSTANAAFSPDSNLLIYTGGWLNNTRIYLADLRTKITQELFSTEKTCNEFQPSWSPDGKWLAFISNCDSEDKQQYDLYLTSLIQKKKIKLDIGIDGYIQDVVWRPANK